MFSHKTGGIICALYGGNSVKDAAKVNATAENKGRNSNCIKNSDLKLHYFFFKKLLSVPVLATFQGFQKYVYQKLILIKP